MGNWTENGHLLKQLIELFFFYLIKQGQRQRSANSTGGGGEGARKLAPETRVGLWGGGEGLGSSFPETFKIDRLGNGIFNFLNEIFPKEKLNLDKVLNKNIFPLQ